MGTEEEEDDEAPVNILTGADWESVNYKVENVSARETKKVVERKTKINLKREKRDKERKNASETGMLLLLTM